MTRVQLERRVDELAAELAGPAFAAAIKELHDELDEQGRLELQEVVLERAANLDQAVMDRVDARGWLRRQWDKAGGGP